MIYNKKEAKIELLSINIRNHPTLLAIIFSKGRLRHRHVFPEERNREINAPLKIAKFFTYFLMNSYAVFG